MGRIFLTGLLTVLPVVATVYFMVWLIGATERVLGRPLQWLIPEGYQTGMGIVIAFALVLGVGVLMREYFFARLFRQLERLLLGVPLVRSIYGALRDMLGLFAGRKEPSLEVVAVTLPGTSLRMLGFVTRADFADLPAGIAGEGEVAVYLPMSYQLGGYTVFVPRSALKPVPMSREDAMKFILTGGLKTV
ncbi:MAG: DUF502 domain-containing protein [Betaproteobacteria bacterium]